MLFYAYGVLLVPMERDLGWSRSALSGVFSLALIVAALLTVPVGRWLDSHEPRALFVCGAIASTALVLLWGQARSPVTFVSAWLLLGACQAVVFYEPAFTVITKWFDGAERHRALTSVTLVAGLASTIFGPLTASLERALGWRGAVAALAALFFAVTLPCFVLLLRRPPVPTRDDRVPAPPLVSTLPRDAFVTRDFWLLTAAYLLNAVTTLAVAVHTVPYLRDRGVRATTAATVLGAVGLVQVLGRSTFVRLSARRPSLHLATGVMLAKSVGLAALVLLPGLIGIPVFVAVYGAANGIATLTRATTIAELYGPDHYGSISSVITAISSIAGAVAPFAAAAAAVAVGAYGPVLLGLGALTLLAAGANEVVARPTRRAVPVEALGEAEPAL